MTPEYDAWNAALAARFLQERPGQPLYLYTDESVLEEVAGDVGVDAAKALPSFLDAVRSTLVGAEPFRRWALESARAVGDGEPPRQLAVLCFLVLVAVERETTRFQYYPELNQHLRRPGQGAPPGFDRHVPRLFVHFNAWLEGAGSRHGTPTAAPPTHFPNVGWPLSQAIVRPTDRALLVRLFFAARLGPRQSRSGSWLRGQIVPRLRTTADSASRTRLLQLHENHRETLDDVLEREYAAWNGEPVASLGPKAARCGCVSTSRTVSGGFSHHGSLGRRATPGASAMHPESCHRSRGSRQRHGTCGDSWVPALSVPSSRGPRSSLEVRASGGCPSTPGPVPGQRLRPATRTARSSSWWRTGTPTRWREGPASSPGRTRHPATPSSWWLPERRGRGRRPRTGGAGRISASLPGRASAQSEHPHLPALPIRGSRRRQRARTGHGEWGRGPPRRWSRIPAAIGLGRGDT